MQFGIRQYNWTQDLEDGITTLSMTLDLLYLLPLQGSDTNWYTNMQKNPNLKISVDGQEIITGNGKAITDQKKVKEVIEKFISKYGDSDIKKFYTKFDVCVELGLKQQ